MIFFLELKKLKTQSKTSIRMNPLKILKKLVPEWNETSNNLILLDFTNK